MNTRINQYLQKKGITPAELAETIGVQRSNISHILNGRNKPSFSFIQRFLESYPDVDSRWLMTGESSKTEVEHTEELSLFSEDNNSSENTKTISEEQNEVPENSVLDSMSTLGAVNSTEKVQKKDFVFPPITENGKTMERIVVFYTDNTFREYKPG